MCINKVEKAIHKNRKKISPASFVCSCETSLTIYSYCQVAQGARLQYGWWCKSSICATSVKLYSAQPSKYVGGMKFTECLNIVSLSIYTIWYICIMESHAVLAISRSCLHSTDNYLGYWWYWRKCLNLMVIWQHLKLYRARFYDWRKDL